MDKAIFAVVDIKSSYILLRMRAIYTRALSPRSSLVYTALYLLQNDHTTTKQKKTALQFAVNNHPKGNWTLVVRIDGDEVLQKSIEDSSWQEFQFDLTKHAGRTIKIELENQASDWAFEAAYWSRIELVE